LAWGEFGIDESFHKTDVQETDLQAGKIPGGKDWGIEPDSQQGILHTEKDGKVMREMIPSLRGNYGDYYDELYTAITENKNVPVPGADGKKVIQVIEAAMKSNMGKRVIDL